ncbi:MAG: RnfABCDGE type electron transport complex subunit D, partial [Pseudomonadales bacterium]|nr:RnfABCDGE type electron transport complex subunit D [Pseudomonadales bacterium]
MGQVVIALIPGAAALVWYFGPGVIVNLTVALVSALTFEALVLYVRGRPLSHLLDGSAAVTGLLLGLCLPPFLPVWMIVIGCLFAIVFAKHLYGGLGQNVFNPAMVGYAVLIIAFPLAMSQWSSPLDPWQSFSQILTTKLGGPVADGITMATPLDTFKFRGALTVSEVWQMGPGFGVVSGTGWESINLAFLLGGLY